MSERRDRIRVHIEQKEYSVVGGDFQEMLAAVKQVAGRRFVSELKVWQLPGKADEVAHQLSISGFELEGGAPIEEPIATPTQTQSGGQAPVSSGDRIRVTINGHQLSVIGGGFREMLEVVKELPGRRFDGNAKVWEIPGDVGVIKGMIEAAGFQLEGAAALLMDGIDPASPPPMEPPDFAATSQNPPPAAAFEAPTFLEEPPWDDDELPDLEPPDWWDDDNMPPPDALQFEPPNFDEPDPFADIPPDFEMQSSPTTASPSAPKTTPPTSGNGDRIRIRLGDIPLVITGGTFKEMLVAVKTIPGRRFNGDEKVWEIPEDTTFDSVNQAMNAAGFTVLPG